MTKLYLIAAFLAYHTASGQTGDAGYPKAYFRNPLDIPIVLAGNFGECRPGHFHSGMDIKTNGVENLPVHAAADGYISRIKMEKGGFGHALYITHANGYTTLYAHLNDFTPGLQRFLKQSQYEKQSWAVDLQLPEDKFPVRKGQQIAWSGNTGASTAPHLHFEIRSTATEHPLNPQQFGFELNDTRPPVPTAIALYDLNKSIYDQTPQFITLKKKGGDYVAEKDTVTVATNRLGIGMEVNDYMNGSDNTLAFYKAEWLLDNEVQGGILLDDIGYDVTRYLHAYADYRTKQKKGNWFQCFFQLPGNKLDGIYKDLNTGKGTLLLNDLAVHKVTIVLTDDAGNKTNVLLQVRSKPASSSAGNCLQVLTANKASDFRDPDIKFTLGSSALYDEVCFHLEKHIDPNAFSSRFKLGESEVPVHTYFDLSIKPDKPIPAPLTDKIVLMCSDGKSEDGRAASYDNGWYKASVRNFGTYWIRADTTAPLITPMQKDKAVLSKATVLSFNVKEDLTSVKSFRAELDGKWICFEPKGNLFIYRFDEHCTKGKHTLLIKAADETGNMRTLRYTFTR